MIVDCFTFFNEFDVLEVRLNSLAPYVDRFVLLEAPVTQRGTSKPLFYADNKERFSKFNITHIIADNFVSVNTWDIEKHQRNLLAQGVEDLSGEDIVLFSDSDEIPNLEKYKIGQEGVFCQQMFYFYFNYRVKPSNAWMGTIAIKKKNISSFQRIRDRRKNRMQRFYPDTPDEQFGWHFSSTGSVEQMMYKFDSFAHTDTDNPITRQKIKENRENLRDPWYKVWSNHSSLRPMWIEMPKGPKWLLDNREKYEHLFLKEGKGDGQ